MIDNSVLDHILGHNDKLPTLPGIALKILEAVQRERPDLKEIGEILATDPSLSAEVLRLINSSLYALPRKVTSVIHAVNMLGLNTVKNLALGFALIKQTRSTEDEQFDYPLFWKSSLTAAVSARLIAQQVAPAVSEDAFLIGLLHDMGMLPLARCMPDQYSLIVGETARDACPRQNAESQVLGFDHMVVGQYLFGSWGLPPHFCLPVSCHHDPQKLESTDAEALKMGRILHLATLYMELFLGGRQNPNLAWSTISQDNTGSRKDSMSMMWAPVFSTRPGKSSLFLSLP